MWQRLGLRVIAPFALLAVVAFEARAAEWGPPTAEFSADMTFEDERGQKREARLYYTAKRQRLEYLAGREPVAVIIDHEANTAWQLFLNRRAYKRLRVIVPEYFFGFSNPASSREEIGKETVGGVATTKYRVKSKTRMGDRFDGTGWATADRIIVKMDGTVTRGDLRRKITMTMSNLKVGQVDGALFQVPGGYELLPEDSKRK